MIRLITTFGSLKIKRALLVTFIAASVSGCAAGAKVLNANEAGITLDYFNEYIWKLDEVYGKAQAHCQSYGKNSLLAMQIGLRYTFICK